MNFKVTNQLLLDLKTKKNEEINQSRKNEKFYFFPFTHGEQLEEMKDEMNQNFKKEYV